ncbi:MAG TPA: hypothetical protein PK231_05790 [Acidocella sp.]|nr:hypothetical protein [Acidocella sp.]
MSYQADIKKLSVLCYARGFTHWLYEGDAKEITSAPAFFVSVTELLSVGDFVSVTSSKASDFGIFVYRGDGKVSSLVVAGEFLGNLATYFWGMGDKP